MKNLKILKIILFISGLVAIFVGGAILFAPATFYLANGIEIGGNVSLLNEIRAPGAYLLVSGFIILLGCFFARLAFTSLMFSTLLYLSYGLSRIFSMQVDGWPADSLFQAAVLEIIIGSICAFALFKYFNKESINEF